MYRRQEVPQPLLRLVVAQSGVLTRAQALGLGLSDTVVKRLLAQQVWGTLEPGIYLAPNIGPTWEGRVWAGVLLGGRGARAGGLTAAALHGLTDDKRLPVDILVPLGIKPPARSWVVFRQERPRVRAASTRAEPPRTRIEDTVLDLCAESSDTACVDWVTTAVQRRLTTAAALARALDGRSRMPRRKLLTSVLADAGSGVHSGLEHRYLHDVERAHQLAPGARQRSTPGRDGFVDVAYIEFGLIVELDGRVGHLEPHRDRRRDNVHTRTGLRTLRFGWHEITEDPCGVALEVAEVLIGLGWSGYPERCPRCR